MSEEKNSEEVSTEEVPTEEVASESAESETQSEKTEAEVTAEDKSTEEKPTEEDSTETEEAQEPSEPAQPEVKLNLVDLENLTTKAIYGKKIGMTQVWDENNKVVPVTVIHAPANIISQIKTLDKDGYCAIQLAANPTKENRITKAEKGHLNKANAGAKAQLVEIRLPSNTSETEGIEIGQAINVEAFTQGEQVDVVGTSKGHGFSGGMKRHNFKGQGASHGNHRAHRVPGSIGACATPARVFKGKKMAGRYGNERVTVQNLKIVGVDAEKEVLLVKGAVPGTKGSNILIKSAVKSVVGAKG